MSLLEILATNDIDEIRTALESGTDVNFKDCDGETPLIVASRNGNTAIVELLLSYFPDANAQNTGGNSALILASWNGRKEVVSALVAFGANIELLDGEDETALYCASRNGHKDIVKLLIDAGASLDVRDKKGNTALIAASFYGRKGAVCELIAAGARCNIHDNAGTTALAAAARNGYKDVVSALIATGANLDIPNMAGKTALSIAVAYKNTDMILTLLCGGASIGLLDEEAYSSLVSMVLADLQSKGDQSPYLVGIGVILEADLPVDVAGNARLHCGRLWFELLVSAEAWRLAALDDFLSSHRVIASVLSRAKDVHGRELYRVISAEAQQLFDKHLAFFGRYELASTVLHQSPTCKVVIAADKRSNNGPVALKFMKHEDQFRREVTAIAALADEMHQHLVGVLCSFAAKDLKEGGDTTLAEECMQCTAPISLADYSYLLVMDAADRTLFDVMIHELGVDCIHVIREILRQVLDAVGHIHRCGYIHGDIKPLNIVRMGARYKVIDLDAAVRIGAIAGMKVTSLAYRPPEMVYRDDGGVYRIKDGSDVTAPYTQVLASPSYDLWSVGIMAYAMLARQSLFQIDSDDNLTNEAEDLARIFNWSLVREQPRLDKIIDRTALNFVSTLLNKGPTRRPRTADHAKEHLFLSPGKRVGRLPGEAASFDVFLSYRVWSDVSHAETLYNQLTLLGLRVWWDKKCLKDGEKWEEGFCTGLVQSDVFVCLLSRGSLENFCKLTPESVCDNVLLEYRLALELRERGFICKLVPVFIGDEPQSHAGHSSFDWSLIKQLSTAEVQAVDSKLLHHLDEQGMGLPLLQGSSAAATMQEFVSFQGTFVQGSFSQFVTEVGAKIISAVEEVKTSVEVAVETYVSVPVEALAQLEGELMRVPLGTCDDVAVRLIRSLLPKHLQSEPGSKKINGLS